MAGQALGAPMQIAGAFMGAKSADRRRKQLEKIAETPGVDIASVYGDTTRAGLAGLGGAQEFAGKANLGAYDDLTGILELAIPGYSAMKDSRAGAIGSMLKGEIPTDVSDAVHRAGASRAVAGGYGGSGMHRNLVSRDLGLTSMDILGRGFDEFARTTATTPLPRMTQASDILNVTGRDTMGLRSGERSERLQMLLGAANAPRGQDVWAKALTDMGGQMASSGGGGGGSLGAIGGILGMI